MKYIRNFNSISDAKQATLYSPTSTLITDDKGISKVLIKEIGDVDTEMHIVGDTLEDLHIAVPKNKILTGTFYVAQEYLEQLTESYEIFRKSNVDIQSVTAKEAKVYINHLKKAGLPYQEQLSEYYKKYSFPFIIFIFVFFNKTSLNFVRAFTIGSFGIKFNLFLYWILYSSKVF